MKLGRRKFFGLAGAAAVGGKKVATDVLSQMGSNPLPPAAMPETAMNVVGGTLGGYNRAAYLQAQVAKYAAAKAMMPGALAEFFHLWHSEFQPNLDDINALVSVSVSAKKRMIRERQHQADMVEWLDRPSRNLKRYLIEEKLGINS